MTDFLTTAEAARYLGRGREWLRQHRAAIGYCREEDGRVSYRAADLDAYRMRFFVPPPAEMGSIRRPRRTGSSAGGLNIVTGDPYGTPYLVASTTSPTTDSWQRKARRA